MLLATLLQRLTPLFQLRLSVCERIGDLARKASCPLQQSIACARRGRRIRQFSVELRQRSVFAGQTHEYLQRIAQTGKNLWRVNRLICLFSQPGGERQQMSLSLIHISEPTRLGMISYAV